MPTVTRNLVIWFDLGAWEWKRFVTQLPGLIFLGNQKQLFASRRSKACMIISVDFFVS